MIKKWSELVNGFFEEKEETRAENQRVKEEQKCGNEKTEFFSKVVGVTYEGRQQYVKKCYAGQELDLIRDKMNIYDSNAIAVYAGDDQVGFIKKESAEIMAPRMDSGTHYRCYVTEVTGGGDKVYGLNIKICES